MKQIINLLAVEKKNPACGLQGLCTDVLIVVVTGQIWLKAKILT